MCYGLKIPPPSPRQDFPFGKHYEGAASRELQQDVSGPSNPAFPIAPQRRRVQERNLFTAEEAFGGAGTSE